MSLLARKNRSPHQTKKFGNATDDFTPPFQIINGRLINYEDNQYNYIVKGHNINDIVFSIVRLITDKVRVPPWGVYTVKDETAYKSLKAEILNKNASYSKLLNLQAKALSPSKNPGKWAELLEQPNNYESFQTQISNAVAFKLLTGNKYRWANILKSGANAGAPAELELMAPQWMKIISNGSFPARAVGYSYDLFPGKTFSTNEIIHDKYFNPNYDNSGQHLYGMSPLRAGLMRLQKSNSQLKAEASGWENEGIKGVLYMKNQVGQVDGELVQPEVAALAETMRNEWQGSSNRRRMGISGYEMGWIPIGLNAEEMQTIESGIMDLRYICNIFGGVPSQLLNDPANKQYNNQREGEKALTSRCVLPELCSEKDSLNMYAKKRGLGPKDVIDFDLSVFSELQADVRETADWTSKLIAISANEQRELCGLAALPEPEMNEPMILSGGRQTAEERSANIVDDALNDGDSENI